MRTIAILCAFLVAAVAADYSCVVPVTGRMGQEVNLTAVPLFSDTEDVIASDGSKQSSKIGVSSCKPASLATGCIGYAYLGLVRKCFDKPPQSFTNGTTNVTTLIFNSTSLRSSSYLFGAAGEIQLTIAYVCDADAVNDNLRYVSGVESRSGDYTLTFGTRAACPVPVAPTTAAPTATTAPTTEAQKDDDDKGLSAWAIVGIVVAAVVVVVVAAVVCYKCRKSDSQGDGEYSRV